MSGKLKIVSALGAVFFLAVGTSAQATSILFTFDSASSGPSLAAGSNSTTIGSYMDAVLGCPSCVTVNGAIADHTYTGEGHVVGPGSGGTSLTLGNSNNQSSSTSSSTFDPTSPTNVLANDNFLANTSDSSSQISSQFTISFTGLHISSVSFDYEIFPDGSQNQPPDFIFTAFNGASSTVVWTKYGVAPGTSGTNAHSPASGSSSTEGSKQVIGTWSGSFSPSLTELEFTDWPATIGIDNLQITYTSCCTGGGPPELVPEPASIPLLGTGLLLGWAMRRKLSQRA